MSHPKWQTQASPPKPSQGRVRAAAQPAAGNEAAGLKATFHSLRHSHASTLIASELDVLTISRRLGHGSPAITLGVYGHLFKTDDRAAAIMEAALTAEREK